jgi:hypothetical protein
MSQPKLEALRRMAAEVDQLAAEIGGRSHRTSAALDRLQWSGPRRDAFVLGCTTDLGGQAGGQVAALRALAADLRALAAEAEDRLAALRRIEAAVRADLAQVLGAALVGAVERELTLLASAVAVVPGMHGVEHQLSLARLQVSRLTTLQARLPPTGDLRWEAVGRQWAAGALP